MAEDGSAIEQPVRAHLQHGERRRLRLLLCHVAETCSLRPARTTLTLEPHSCVMQASSNVAGPAFEALTDIQKGQVVAYINMLMEWNTKMNITGAMMSSASPILHGISFFLSFADTSCMAYSVGQSVVLLE